MLVRILRNWNPCARLVGTGSGAATMENGGMVPPRLGHGTAEGSSDSACRYTPAKTEGDASGYLNTNVHSSIFHK